MNLLSQETSPYLLQHQDNPVHWRPWGEKALQEAKAQDKPILLSIGYAACHWCHVMAHESFEDEAVAALMNDHFIPVKVDREERPDIDHIYMNALHAMGEQGGWPLTMFLDPQGLPFWGGTYFPPESKYGRPGFKHVLRELHRIWTTERGKIDQNTALFAASFSNPQATGSAPLAAETATAAARTLLQYVDANHGGLRGAPKFPQAPLFKFLWAAGRRSSEKTMMNAVEHTLIHICQGGIYDHIGGGFARYSVDDRWLVPHFEKMLYDNAQLVSLMARVWLETGNSLFRQRIEETLAFVLAEMRTPHGAFAASYDADSEGHEGKYYVWTLAEIQDLLGPSAKTFAPAYGITADGNWEGVAIPNRLHALTDDSQPYQQERATLLAARRKRAPPGFDDKILADWNGLMIAAFAEAALVFNRPDWQAAAEAAFSALLASHWKDGTLHHAYRAGRLQHFATAEGYANLITAALALNTLSPGGGYLGWAVRLNEALNRDHWEGHAYLFASRQTNDLIARQSFAQDNATPNPHGVMAANLIKLHSLTGEAVYRDQAAAILATFASEAANSPFGAPGLLEAAFALEDQIEVKADHNHPLFPELLKCAGLGAAFLPPAALDGAALICRGQSCSLPIRTAGDLAEARLLLQL